MLLDAWPSILARVPEALLVLAPRHPERFAAVAALVRKRELTLIKRSGWQGTALAQGSVFLLDSIGELGAVYGLASVAFVGGSLVAAGGHNPLEPARFSVPIVMGPHVENFRGVTDELVDAGALRLVSPAELEDALASLLADPQESVAIGERGRTVLQQHAGATERVLGEMLRLLEEGEP